MVKKYIKNWNNRFDKLTYYIENKQQIFIEIIE